MRLREWIRQDSRNVARNSQSRGYLRENHYGIGSFGLGPPTTDNSSSLQEYGKVVSGRWSMVGGLKSKRPNDVMRFLDALQRRSLNPRELDALIRCQQAKRRRYLRQSLETVRDGVNRTSSALHAIDQDEAITDAPHRIQTMRHNERAAIIENPFESVLHQSLRGRIQRTGGFVDDHESRFFQRRGT